MGKLQCGKTACPYTKCILDCPFRKINQAEIDELIKKVVQK